VSRSAPSVATSSAPPNTRLTANRTFMNALSPDRFPTLCALSSSWSAFDPDKAFHFALGMLLDGFAAHLHKERPARAHRRAPRTN
jgi:hypothetical protein